VDALRTGCALPKGPDDLEGKEILVAPSSPSAGVRVAMILDDGAPVELLEFAPDVGAKTGAGNSV
jgi:hypothetical protein